MHCHQTNKYEQHPKASDQSWRGIAPLQSQLGWHMPLLPRHFPRLCTAVHQTVNSTECGHLAAVSRHTTLPVPLNVILMVSSRTKVTSGPKCGNKTAEHILTNQLWYFNNATEHSQSLPASVVALWCEYEEQRTTKPIIGSLDHVRNSRKQSRHRAEIEHILTNQLWYFNNATEHSQSLPASVADYL